MTFVFVRPSGVEGVKDAFYVDEPSTHATWVANCQILARELRAGGETVGVPDRGLRYVNPEVWTPSMVDWFCLNLLTDNPRGDQGAHTTD